MSNASWCSEKSESVVQCLAQLAELTRGNLEAQGEVLSALWDATKLLAVHIEETRPEGALDSNGWNPGDAELVLKGGTAAVPALLHRYRTGDDRGYRAAMESEAHDQVRDSLNDALDRAGLPRVRGKP